MQTRDLAKLTFVITGIYALIASLPLLQALATMPFFPEETRGHTVVIILAWLLPFLILVFTGIGLIIRRDRLAQWLFPEIEQPEPTVARNDQVEDLAFAILGIYLVVSTLPNLGSVASTLINLRGSETFHEYLGVFRDNLMFYLGTITKLIVGTYLFMYAHSAGHWWRERKRSRSHVKPEPQEPATATCPNCSHQFSPAEYRLDADIRLCSNCQEPLPDELFEKPA